MLEGWGKHNKIYKEDHILDMMTNVFSYMSKCFDKKHLLMYFIPKINLLQQYPLTSNESLDLKKEQERVETLDQILTKLSNKESMINIISSIFQRVFRGIVHLIRSICVE